MKLAGIVAVAFLAFASTSYAFTACFEVSDIEDTIYPNFVTPEGPHQAGHDARDMYDFKANTYYASNQPGGTTVTFTFNINVLLSSVDILWQDTGRINYFSVQISYNGDDWMTVLDAQSSGNGSGQFESYNLNVTQPIVSRYARLIGHGNNSPRPKTAEWMSVSEIEWYGFSLVGLSGVRE